jgi:hypothetical protein
MLLVHCKLLLGVILCLPFRLFERFQLGLCCAELGCGSVGLTGALESRGGGRERESVCESERRERERERVPEHGAAVATRLSRVRQEFRIGGRCCG